MIGDGDELVPPEKCPNCGSELHPDRDVCPQCGHMRAVPEAGASTVGVPPVVAPPIGMPATTTAGSKVGAAAIGCGAAFVAAIACGIGLVYVLQWQLGPAIVFTLQAVIAVLCFLGFRAILGRNPNARPALYAFVIVFVVLFGGFMACIYSFNNFRVQ